MNQAGVLRRIEMVSSEDKMLAEKLNVMIGKVKEVKDTTVRHSVNSLVIIGKSLMWVYQLARIVISIFILALLNTFLVPVIFKPISGSLNSLAEASSISIGPAMILFWSWTLTIAILLYGLITLFPGQHKEKAYKWVTYLLLAVFIPTTLFLAVQESGYESDELREIVVEGTSTSIGSAFAEIKCAVDLECQRQKLNTETAETTSRADFKISLNTPEYGAFAPSDLEKPLELNYKITSTEPIIFTGISCALSTSKDEPFYTEELSIELVDVEDYLLEGIVCGNLDKLEREEQREDFRIVTFLKFETTTTITQSIPVVNYEYMVSKAGLSLIDAPSRQRLTDPLQEEVAEDLFFKHTGNALEIDDGEFGKKLPLLFGDDEQDRELSLILTLSPKTTSSLELLSLQVVDYSIPENLLLTNEDEVSNTKKTFGENKATQRFEFQENEGAFDVETKKAPNLNIIINSEFEKEERFVLSVFDENFGQDTTSEDSN